LGLAQFEPILAQEWFICICICRCRCRCLSVLVQLQVKQLLLSGNGLEGPALPASWLEPAALPALEVLQLDGNPGLSGSLPPTLAWKRLQRL